MSKYSDYAKESSERNARIERFIGLPEGTYAKSNAGWKQTLASTAETSHILGNVIRATTHERNHRTASRILGR